MLETGPIVIDWTSAIVPQPVTLRGRYVTLEPLDADRHTTALWAGVRGQDALWTWMADGPFESEASFHEAIAAKQHATNAVFFAIVPNGAAETTGSIQSQPGAGAAGFASYLRIEPLHGVVEVGNILLSPGLQRTRAATEAMFLMARHVFDDLGYRRYEWKCNALNEPSRRAAERLGFNFEGIFRQHMVIKGCNRDTAWFSMLDHDWPSRKVAFEKWLDPKNFDVSGRQRRRLDDIRKEVKPTSF